MKQLLLFVFVLAATAQYMHTTAKELPGKKERGSAIKGSVIDKNTGEPLTGVEIRVSELNMTVYTDFDGMFELRNLPPGSYCLTTQMVAYRFNCQTVELGRRERPTVQIQLEEKQ